MRQHGRDDIGVMDLATSEGIAAAELHEPIPHWRAVLEDSEASPKCRGVRGRLGKSEGFSPNLLSRHNGDVLAQDLSADRERLGGGHPGEGGPGPFAERRAAGRCVDENVGVDETHRPSSAYMSSRRRLSPSGQTPRSWLGRASTSKGSLALCRVGGGFTIIVTSCSPGGTAAGAVPAMRWSEPTRTRARISVIGPSCEVD